MRSVKGKFIIYIKCFVLYIITVKLNSLYQKSSDKYSIWISSYRYKNYFGSQNIQYLIIIDYNYYIFISTLI